MFLPQKETVRFYCHRFRRYAADLLEIFALRRTRNSIKNAALRNAQCHNPIWYAIRRSVLAVCLWAVNSADCTDKCTFIFLRELRFGTWFMPRRSPARPACVVFGRGAPSTPSSNLFLLFARTMGIFLNRTFFKGLISGSTRKTRWARQSMIG